MPASKPFRFHSEAWQELEAADDRYLQRSADASIDFLTVIGDALDRITEAPRRWPKHLHDTRRLVLQRFPFSVVYLDDPSVIVIIAVAHAKRKPGYWRDRL